MNQPDSLWLHDTVSALVYSIVANQKRKGDLSLPAPCNDLTWFVLEQQARMPDYLRAPMRVLTRGFDCLSGFRFGRPFRTLPPGERARRLSGWKKAGMAFQRDFVRYYESLVTFGLHTRAEQAAPATARADGDGGIRTAIEPRGEMDCEIAVVGSGPGGALTASMLAEAGRKVLLIEEGPFYSLESCLPFSREEMVQKYRNGGQTVAMGANKIAYVEGRCVGGGSEINSGLYHRTPPDVLEIWRRDYGVEALTETEMLPHFEACERDLSVSLLPGPAPAASLKLHAGAQKLGWKSLEVPRWFAYSGETASPGVRQSMTKTFVPRFLAAGGQVLACTRVNRLRQEGAQWMLTADHERAGAIRVRAGTVFVCGGAVQTPALLRRSGIRRNIGDSLRLHPTVKLVARFAETVNAADMGVPVHQVKEFAPRLSFGCSISNPAYLALGLLDQPEALREVSTSWNQMAAYYAMAASAGQGTVRGFGSFRDPLVRCQLPLEDRRTLAEGLRKLSGLLLEAGAVAIYPGVARSPAILSPQDVRKMPDILPSGLANLMTIHLFSSCPMGEDSRRCAADSFGRVRGLQNLHINDASLLCTAPGVNPQGSIMAVARRNVLHFLRRL